MKELRTDGSLPGEDQFARIYKVRGEDGEGFNMWGGETPDDESWPSQADIERYKTFVAWETDVIEYKEARERLRVLNKVPRFDISTLLLDIGLDGTIPTLFEKVYERDIVLGKLDMAKLSMKQLNTLFSLQATFSSQHMRLYFDESGTLVLTNQYRYQDVRDTHELAWCYMTMGLDFIFDKNRPQDCFA